MTDIFLGFLNRSLAAGILILAVVLVRLVFKKAPRWLLCALWALAAVRLEPKRMQLLAYDTKKPPYAVLVEAVKEGGPGLEVLPVQHQAGTSIT